MCLVRLFLLECHNRNASYNDASGSILTFSSFFQLSAAFTLLSLCLSLSLSFSLSLSVLSETTAPGLCVSSDSSC